MVHLIKPVIGSIVIIIAIWQAYKLGYKHNKENKHKIKDLQIGGNCGCCGDWVGDMILEKNWPVTLCKKCRQLSE